jgi:hypothetical protein
MRAPVRCIRGRWPAILEWRAPRLFRTDPRVLLDTQPEPDAFREAMSMLYVGQTIKITGSRRHDQADDLLLGAVDLQGATILDIGASDGSTSVDLVAKLPAFSAYVIADLYLEVDAVCVGRTVVFFDRADVCILVAGRRFVAWPSLSRTVRLLCTPLEMRARRRPRESVRLLGPAARDLMRSDPRVVATVHDVFQPWPDPHPHVIKVANLLRRLYFSDADILRGLSALHASLDDGGHLLIVDNPRIPGIAVRAGLYRRDGQRFTTVSQTAEQPEIADLISEARFRSADLSVTH